MIAKAGTGSVAPATRCVGSLSCWQNRPFPSPGGAGRSITTTRKLSVSVRGGRLSRRSWRRRKV